MPLMKSQGGGQVVNTASLAGLVHAPAMGAYNATKAAVVAMSETVRGELAPFGIEVSVICPSFFRTNLAESLAGSDRAVEASAVELINASPRSAPQVAAVVYRGMKAGRPVILTDAEGYIAWSAKRWVRPAYDLGMAAVGRRIGAGKPPEPAVVREFSKLARRLGKKS